MARPQLKDQMQEAVHILLSHPEIGEIERYRGGFRIKRKDTTLRGTNNYYKSIC